MSSKPPRRSFAPLGVSPGKENGAGEPLRGIVFDMDGTLCEPQNYMFKEMRDALQIDKSIDILDHINMLSEQEQKEAFRKIQDIESNAMVKQMPQIGLVPLMEYLDRNNILKAICTRNFDSPVNHFLEHHIPKHLNAFTPIITRDFKPPKPSPHGILHIAHAWKVVESASVPETAAQERSIPLLMVGDSVDDMAAGRDAGCVTVLLKSDGKEDLETDSRTDVVISRLDELVELLQNGLRAR